MEQEIFSFLVEIVEFFAVILFFIVISRFWYRLFLKTGLWVKEKPDDIIEPEIEYTGIKLDIDHNDYHHYIVLKGGNESVIKEIIYYFGYEMYIEPDETDNFMGNPIYKIASFAKWHIVKIPEEISACTYYYLQDLFGFITDFEISIGFAKNTINMSNTYWFFVNQDNGPQVGGFENGKSLFIYLPETCEENAYLNETEDINISINDLKDKLLKNGLKINEIEQLHYKDIIV